MANSPTFIVPSFENSVSFGTDMKTHDSREWPPLTMCMEAAASGMCFFFI